MGAIKLFNILLFLVPVLQFTETVVDPTAFSSYVGVDVELRCGNEPDHQAKCNVTWLFSSSNQAATTLFEYEKIVQGGRANRLSVTGKYSLNIHKVKAEDTGRYTCRKFNNSGAQCGKDKEYNLTVVPNTKATTTKSTSTTTTTPSQTTKTSTEAKSTTAGTNPTAALIDGSPAKPVWWWFAVPCVGLTALMLIVVSVIRLKRTRGNRTRVDDNNADPEDGAAYASISYTKNTNGKAQHKDDEDDAVTYSTMKSPSSPAADPSDLYASVNKQKK